LFQRTHQVSPELSSEPIPEILEAASNYLYFMQFIKTVSPDTIRAYQSDLAQAFHFDGEFFSSAVAAGTRLTGRISRLDDTRLLVLCRDALTRWSKLAPASRNRKTACLKSFLNWLHDENVIERDLAVHLHAPRAPVRLPHHLSVDEALSLLDSIRRDEEEAGDEKARLQCVRDLALILLLYGGGLRVSEASALQWSQVERNGKVLRILGKGSKERMIALPPLATSALLRMKRTSGHEDFVFGGTGLSTRAAYEIVRSRGARCGLLKPLHPHALRHSYATHLLSSGANLRTLQELLGHSSLQATQRYTHLGLDQLANTLEAFHPLGEEAQGILSANESRGKRRRS
jgi:site-specific recombinase XerD